jgi:hypothetical protein
MPKQVDGFAFLKDVDNDTLATWNTFADSPFRAFMVKHFEGKIHALQEGMSTLEKYITEPYKLAYEQGKIFGMRLVVEKFFNDIRTEYQRRLDRDANAGSPKSR